MNEPRGEQSTNLDDVGLPGAAHATGKFFVEPKVKTIRGQQTTRWELSLQRPGDPASTTVIGDYRSKRGAMRGRVTHPDREGDGAVVDSGAPAWTTNELTIDPPAAGMIKVCWFNSVNTTQLHWEFVTELQPIEVE